MASDEHDVMAAQFEENRAHLRSVAYRMLGSTADADDAVQEAWLRLSRSGTAGIENLGGWLTTVVARVCLDMLRARTSRREDGAKAPEPASDAETSPAEGPEQQAVMADSIGLALLVVLETLTPAERVAFVLHDLFDLPFDEIAPIVGRTPTAARQLASRARRRVRGAPQRGGADKSRQREIVDAFLAASRGGDVEALVALLDPEVVLRADGAAVATGAPAELVGAGPVAETFAGRAKVAKVALIGGSIGLVWAPAGTPKVAFALEFGPDRIVGIRLIADPDTLQRVDPVILPA
jgi:RNA polymerase sigma-70 factor (ECF subfamily)